MASVLVVDVGTSSVRVSAISQDGAVMARVQGPSGITYDGDEVTLDPEQLWSAIAKLCQDVVGTAGQPDVIGVTALLGTVVVDEEFTALTPALLWQDRRAHDQAAALRARLGDQVMRIAGRPVAAELTAPKLIWLHEHEPATLARARWAFSLKDYLIARLTGNACSDHTHAAYTMLCDVAARAWSEELISASGVAGGLLPPLVTADAVTGTVTAAAADSTGVPPGTPVAAGGPDGTVGALGAGAVREGTTVDIAGTTDVIVHTVAQPRRDPAGSCLLNPYILGDLWTLGGPTGQTGGAVSWLLGVLAPGTAPERQLEQAMQVEPGSDGVHVHPTLTGERFPTWRAEVAGAIRGLRPHHTTAHVLRAAYEGAAFVVREGLEALERLGQDVDEVTVVGGVARDRRALQLRADTWGVTVRSVADQEATSIGAAMLGTVAAGIHDDLKTAAGLMVRPGISVRPNPEHRSVLDDAYARWRRRGDT